MSRGLRRYDSPLFLARALFLFFFHCSRLFHAALDPWDGWRVRHVAVRAKVRLRHAPFPSPSRSRGAEREPDARGGGRAVAPGRVDAGKLVSQPLPHLHPVLQWHGMCGLSRQQQPAPSIGRRRVYHWCCVLFPRGVLGGACAYSRAAPHQQNGLGKALNAARTACGGVRGYPLLRGMSCRLQLTVLHCTGTLAKVLTHFALACQPEVVQDEARRFFFCHHRQGQDGRALLA